MDFFWNKGFTLALHITSMICYVQINNCREFRIARTWAVGGFKDSIYLLRITATVHIRTWTAWCCGRSNQMLCQSTLRIQRPDRDSGRDSREAHGSPSQGHSRPAGPLWWRTPRSSGLGDDRRSTSGCGELQGGLRLQKNGYRALASRYIWACSTETCHIQNWNCRYVICIVIVSETLQVI